MGQRPAIYSVEWRLLTFNPEWNLSHFDFCGVEYQIADNGCLGDDFMGLSLVREPWFPISDIIRLKYASVYVWFKKSMKNNWLIGFTGVIIHPEGSGLFEYKHAGVLILKIKTVLFLRRDSICFYVKTQPIVIFVFV